MSGKDSKSEATEPRMRKSPMYFEALEIIVNTSIVPVFAKHWEIAMILESKVGLAKRTVPFSLYFCISL